LNATESIQTRAERLVVSLLGSRSAVGVVYQQDKRVELLSFGFLRFVVVVVVLGLQGWKNIVCSFLIIFLFLIFNTSRAD
jgi:hypothetical protein